MSFLSCLYLPVLNVGCDLQHANHGALKHSYRELDLWLQYNLKRFVNISVLNLQFEAKLVLFFFYFAGVLSTNNFSCALQHSSEDRIFFLLLQLLLRHFIRLKVFWTKKCAISGLIMGFIGLKNRNLSTLSPPPSAHTQTHTHSHWTLGQIGWPAEWVCAVVMIRLLNRAVLCHASCWASGLTKGIWSINSLSLSRFFPICFFFQSCHHSFFIYKHIENLTDCLVANWNTCGIYINIWYWIMIT